MNKNSNLWKFAARCLPVLGSFALAAQAAPLNVCTTTPDLGDLVRQVGGEDVSVTVFAKGVEDPHYVEAKPGFIRALSKAHLYVQNGMELEMGWAPVLLKNASNAKVLPGQPGHFDASRFITPLDVPQGVVDRSMGDVHPAGNPHYLLDPLNGLKVADGLRAKLSEIRPNQTAEFQKRYDAFAAKMKAGLAEWEALLKPHAGAKLIADHNLWSYFAAHYGLAVTGYLEPRPGISPTTKHLGEVVAKMKAENIRAVVSSPYFDPRHASFVKTHTGCNVADCAHQVGARGGTPDYFAMCEHNAKTVAKALGDK